VREGGLYYCKQDSPGRPARMTDWFCTHIAQHVGFATAECAIIEDDEGSSFFGSLHHSSSQDTFVCQNFLATPQNDEVGGRTGWVGQYLAGVFSLDFVLANPDRDTQNFVLRRDGNRLNLSPIDYASARLDLLRTRQFPIAPARTTLVGKLLQKVHGRFSESAIEMVDRIAAIPASVIEGILVGIPEDWSDATQKEGLCDAWSSSQFRDRLAALRAGIRDGTLL
jgi:hypothetical protein